MLYPNLDNLNSTNTHKFEEGEKEIRIRPAGIAYDIKGVWARYGETISLNVASGAWLTALLALLKSEGILTDSNRAEEIFEALVDFLQEKHPMLFYKKNGDRGILPEKFSDE